MLIFTILDIKMGKFKRYLFKNNINPSLNVNNILISIFQNITKNLMRIVALFYIFSDLFRIWKEGSLFLISASAFNLAICFFLYIYICFIYLFLAALVLRCCTQLSLVVASGGHSSVWCAGFSLRWLPLLRSMGFRCAGSVVVARGSVVVVSGSRAQA